MKFHNVLVARYGAQMSARIFHPMLARLRASTRLAVLVLLVFAMKIGMAAACQANDARLALVGDSAIVGTATDGEVGCCSVLDCGDCCAHATVLIPQSSVLPPLAATAALPQWAIGWVPTTYPVAIRPPIAA